MEQERGVSGRDNPGKHPGWTASLPIPGWLQRYGLAVVAVAAAFGLRLALTAWAGPGLPIYITFYPAVMVAALLAGFGPGLLATALTMLVAAIWILPPEGFAVGLPVDILGLVLFACMGLFMSAVALLYHRNRFQVAAYERELALRKSQEALRESEERFSKVFHEAPVGMCLLRRDTGVLADVNSTFLEITGVQREEAVGHTFTELGLIPNRSDRELLMKEMREQGGYRNKDFRLRRKDGAIRDVIINAQVLHVGDDHYFLGMISDITERKRAEEALQKAKDELEMRVRDRTAELAKSMERFRQTLDNMLEGCMIIGFDWSYIYLNDTAAKHGHRKKEDLLGRTMLEMYPGVEQSAVFAGYRRCMEERNPQRFETSYSFPDGTTEWFEFSVEPVPEGIFVLSLDVTERKRAEAALVQVERALGEAKRLSDVGALAASVAHELRNPLGVIQMAAYNLRKKSQNPALEKHLANIEKKVLESGQIINNLLGYARIKMPLFQEVSIPDLVNECLADTARRFQGHNITIHKDLKEIEKETIPADPVQIKEILTNIITNAYQAIEEKKGRIEIRGTRIPEGGVEIRISDNGVGIEKEDLERVFDPFFTRKSKGTGLGLSLSLELVRLHSGRIEVESDKGKGTTVTIYLPRRRKEP